MTSQACRAAACLLLLAALPAPSRSQELESAVKDSYPTNLALLGEATRSAVAELLLGFNAPLERELLLEASGTQEGTWFVENHLLTYLTEAGYQAYLKESATPGPSLSESLGHAAVPADADSAVADSLDGDLSSALPGEPRLPAGEPEIEEPRPEYVLRYRVVQFEITYPDNYKTSPLGSRKVQRRASVSVMAHLLRGEREDVVWVGSGDVERLDVVPASKLPFLEGPNFPFTKPKLETRGVGSLVEPVLVTGIVAGLIYLFYTNQN